MEDLFKRDGLHPNFEQRYRLDSSEEAMDVAGALLLHALSQVCSATKALDTDVFVDVAESVATARNIVDLFKRRVDLAEKIIRATRIHKIIALDMSPDELKIFEEAQAFVSQEAAEQNP